MHKLNLWRSEDGYDYFVISNDDRQVADETERAIVSGLLRGYCHHTNMTEHHRGRLFDTIQQFILAGKDLKASMLHDMHRMAKVRAHRFQWHLEPHSGEWADTRSQWGVAAARRRTRIAEHLLQRSSIQRLAEKHLSKPLAFQDIVAAVEAHVQDKTEVEKAQVNPNTFMDEVEQRVLDRVVPAVLEHLQALEEQLAAVERRAQRIENGLSNGNMRAKP